MILTLEEFLKQSGGTIQDIKSSSPYAPVSKPSALSQLGDKIDSNIQEIANENIDTPISGGVKALGSTAGLLAGEALNAVGSVIPQGVKDVASSAYKTAVEATDMSNNPLVQKGALAIADTYNKLPQEAQNVVEGSAELAATILPVGKGVTLGTKGVGAGAKAVASRAESVANTVAPVLKGVNNITDMALEGLSRVPARVSTNLAEKQAVAEAIKTLPSKIAQNAVRDGIDIQDVKDLSSVTRNPQTNKVIKAVQDFASGKSKVDPISVVGEPIIAGVRQVEKAGKVVGAQLGEISKNIGVLTKPELESGVLNRLQGVRGLENVAVNNGKLNFTGTTLESSLSKADRVAIQEAYKEATKWGDGQKAHMFRQTLFENLGGKKKSLTNITDTQEKAFEAIRGGLSDVIETKSPEYKKVSNQYRKIIQPLQDLRKVMKNIDPTGSEDIANMSAGLLARRLTSASASNPQIRQILQKLDSAIGGGSIGKTVVDSQDLYNILNKYYDIAPKTGFQNLVKEGVGGGESIIGMTKETLKNVAGKSNAVRQKALEELLK